MTIKILVLKSGEDVIADIKEMMTSDNQVMGYLLTKPCVVKLMSAAPLTAEEDDSNIEGSSEVRIRMHPWAPLAKEKEVPLSTEWVVTMFSPIEKVLDMYKKQVLKENGKTDTTDSSDQQSKIGLTD
tara:strand:+ start:1141 stop:1521 length:381 start_codon:yes stop_codon:yes gene_type:complete